MLPAVTVQVHCFSYCPVLLHCKISLMKQLGALPSLLSIKLRKNKLLKLFRLSFSSKGMCWQWLRMNRAEPTSMNTGIVIFEYLLVAV